MTTSVFTANIVDECLQSEDITRMDWQHTHPDLNPSNRACVGYAWRTNAARQPPTCLPELRGHCLITGSTDSIERKTLMKGLQKSEDSQMKLIPHQILIKSKYIPTIEDLIVPQESDKDFQEIPELGKHYSETWPLEDLKKEMIE
ncbi:hypothetical protein TNCV_1059871, partial [Trichonephila clavipes]